MTDSTLPLEIDAAGLKADLDRGDDLVLLDCREQNEWDTVHIRGAQLVPMSEIASQLEKLEPLRERRIVVYCHHGGRSMRVTQWLRQQGFPRTQSLAGGIDNWAEAIDPTLPRY